MNRVFRLNNKPILNFVDLQREFSPIEVYRQLPAFQSFAKVHCVPLPLLVSHTEDGETRKAAACFLDKAFWLGILQNAAWPEAQSAAECFAYFKNETYRAALGLKSPADKEENAVQAGSTKAGIEAETADEQIEEKLAFICKSTGLGETSEDARKAVTLLAVCEIAEMNALSCSFENLQAEPETGASDPDQPDEITAFPYENNAPLSVGVKPYRFWYYDDDTLTAGSRITTVRVEAKGGSNKYDIVTIELYSQKDKSCVQTITLREGEYRYCNVADGKIIKFLPSISLSDSLCLIRRDYSRPEISVLAYGSDSWVFHMESVSCFAAGERDAGFLFLQNGKVSTGFYKAAENYMVRLRFETIPEPLAEVVITQDGYKLLTASGTVISDTACNGETGVVSLDRYSRAPLPVVQNAADVQEAALSDSGKSVALKFYGGNKDKIMFERNANPFTVRQEHGAPVIVL